MTSKLNLLYKLNAIMCLVLIFAMQEVLAQLPSALQDNKADLVFIKDLNSGGGVKVEVANGADNFQSVILDQYSILPLDGFKGSYSLSDVNKDGNLDLVFIKDQNSGGNVLVQAANGADNFQSLLLNSYSTLPLDAFNGKYSLVDVNRDFIPDLVFIKFMNTGGGVQVIAANGADGYKSMILNAYSIFPLDAFNGTYSLADVNKDAIPDLIFIKDQNSGGNVLVQVANGADNFQSLLINTYSILRLDAFNGKYSLVDVNGDGWRDLAFIMDQNSGGGVLVKAANGADNFQSLILDAYSVLPLDAFNGSYSLTEPVITRATIPRRPRCPSILCQ